MKFLRAAAILALALAPATALFAAEGHFDKTFAVTGSPRLSISTGSGYIHVTPGRAGEIHITGYVRSSGWFFGASTSQVRSVVNHPPVQQNGNEIEVGHRHYSGLSINYVVTAPHGTVIESDTGSGNINVSNLGAPLTAGTGSGNIFANNLTGNVTLHTGSGNITARMRAAAYVRATTGSGNIHLYNVTGALNAQTGSGNIEAGGRPSGEWRLVTGSGDVTLHTGSAGMMLDASTGSGDIHSNPSISTHGNTNRHHTTGDINGGGPIVHVQTGSGNIRIY